MVPAALFLAQRSGEIALAFYAAGAAESAPLEQPAISRTAAAVTARAARIACRLALTPWAGRYLDRCLGRGQD